MQYDLIIVGAGPAGIATAEYFINSSKKVLIIESGNDNTIKNYNSKKDKINGHFKINFKNERKRAFFGTTALWKKSGVGGTFWEFDYLDFEKDKHLKWGISFTDLKKSYSEAWNYLNIKKVEEKSFPKIKNNRWKDLIKKYNIKSASTYYTFGSNYNNFISGKKKELLNSKNIKFLYNTTLENIILNNKKNKVDRLIIIENNKKYSVFCKDIVLASGCFENNKILFDLKNKNNLNLKAIGKYLTFHPSKSIGKINLENNKYFNQKDLKELEKVFILKNINQKNLDKFNYGISINPEFNNNYIRKSIIRKIYIIKNSFFGINIKTFISYLVPFITNLDFLEYLSYKIKNYFTKIKKIDVAIVFEHLPNRSNCLVVNKKNHSLNIKSYLSKKNLKYLEDIIKINQLIFKDVYPNFQSKKINIDNLSFETNNHHHGGTVIGSGDKGVVNENLKVNNINNLYVAGSSVFPNSSIYNPTLTIIAISLRLSKYLFLKKV